MLVLQQFVTEPHACPYLPEREATLRYSYAASLSPDEYEALMDSGHRKFGAVFYRTECQGCRACQPIRVPVDAFQPDQSQRRAVRANADLDVRVARPTVDVARLELYARYHRAQTAKKGWPDAAKDAREYEFNFVHNPVPALELSVWDGRELRAVLIADATPRVLSLVYHFHDPEHAKRGLGTFVILRAIELARTMGRRWVYLGFHVEGCPSMAYKSRFRPCELMDADGVWRPFAQRPRG
jgi:arginine-tRNA-protein transferase